MMMKVQSKVDMGGKPSKLNGLIYLILDAGFKIPLAPKVEIQVGLRLLRRMFSYNTTTARDT